MTKSVVAGIGLLLFSIFAQSAVISATSGGVFSRDRVVIEGNLQDSENMAYYLAYANCAKDKQKASILNVLENSCKENKIVNTPVQVCKTSLEYQCINKDENLSIGFGYDGRYLKRAKIEHDGKLRKASKKSIVDALDSCGDEGVNKQAPAETVGYCKDTVVGQQNNVVRKCEALTTVSCNPKEAPEYNILNHDFKIK